MYNPIDSCYKKAIEICGVKATIDNTDTKILIREANDSYGVDYKKIISSQDIKQGDYVFIDGVQYLICDIEDKMSQSIYHVGTFRKCLPIILESNSKEVYAIVDKLKGVYVQGQQITEVHDQYNFIVPKSSCKYTSISTANNMIAYAGGSYDAISIDDSKEGILTITGRFNTTYNPHVYTITLNSNSQTIVETDIFQIVASCTDNGTTVASPVIVYSSSNIDVATVNSSGVITGVSVGSATIVATYNNVIATIAMTINAKSIIPVIAYTASWSNTTTLKTYSSSTMTPTKTLNGVDDSANMNVTYLFDATGTSLLSSGKITIVKKTGTLNSWTIKNVSVSTATDIHVTFIDTVTGVKILDAQLIALKPM